MLVVFALFGIGGFLFYTFIYGAMGALVSKTEDINKSAGRRADGNYDCLLYYTCIFDEC